MMHISMKFFQGFVEKMVYKINCGEELAQLNNSIAAYALKKWKIQKGTIM